MRMIVTVSNASITAPTLIASTRREKYAPIFVILYMHCCLVLFQQVQ